MQAKSNPIIAGDCLSTLFQVERLPESEHVKAHAAAQLLGELICAFLAEGE